MEKIHQLSNQEFNADLFWNTVMISMPGISIANKEKLQGNTIKALFTLCPLYQQGTLEKSELLQKPNTLPDSRVAGKWDALQKVISHMQTSLNGANKTLDVTIVFANKGVLLNHVPTQADEEALRYHEQLYKQAVLAFCKEKGIQARFLTYDSKEIDVRFPKFINPNDEIPGISRLTDDSRRDVIDAENPNDMILLLNQYMTSFGLKNAISEVRTKTRQTIKDLIKAFGTKTTFWLVAGYLAFDGKIPELIGENGIYMATERFAPLFKIARLTPPLYSMTRVEIPA
jgi:hypothetical protein